MPRYPKSSAGRKALPIAEGVLDYFPDAIAYVAFVSRLGNEKHNPGEKMHWSREKSTDHRDCIARHLVESGTYDVEGVLHDGALAWRALANLQLKLEELEKQGHDVWALFGGLGQKSKLQTHLVEHCEMVGLSREPLT
jgi:hypothetical protein